MTEILRTSSTPGVSIGTMIILACWCRFSAAGLVTAITIQKEAPSAEEVNHFRPLITYASPSRTAAVSIQVGFDPGRSGSTMPIQLRIAPSMSGFKNVCFCLSLPKWDSNSILPISGAWQLKV